MVSNPLFGKPKPSAEIPPNKPEATTSTKEENDGKDKGTEKRKEKEKEKVKEKEKEKKEKDDDLPQTEIKRKSKGKEKLKEEQAPAVDTTGHTEAGILHGDAYLDEEEEVSTSFMAGVQGKFVYSDYPFLLDAATKVEHWNVNLHNG